QNRLGRPVVLFQPDDGGIWVVVFEVHNIADIGPAEGIDRLVRVTYDGQLPAFGFNTRRLAWGAGELSDYTVLGVVGVLILIHQHMPEAAPIVVQNGREGIEHVHYVGDEIVEVHRIGGAQSGGVFLIDFGDGLVPGVASCGGSKCFVVDELVFQR